MLDLLVQLEEQGLTYTTLNTTRSPVPTITLCTDRTSIGSHPKVPRFMKGIHEHTPPTPRNRSTLDLQPVLSYCSVLRPIEKLGH